MATPNDRKYTPSHEWIQINGNVGTVGLSEFAIHAIKDVVFLELPPAGKEAVALSPFGVIESVKAVFDLNAPLSGKITEVNSPLQDNFDSLTSDCYGKGWLIKIELSSTDTSKLMDAAAYDKFCAEDHH